MTPWLLAFFIAALVSLIATRIVIAIGISDLPNEARKLHTKVTPTSGGLGIIAGVGAGTIVFFSARQVPISFQLVACLILAMLGGILGFVDDIKALGGKPKLLVMLAITAIFVTFGGRIETFEVTPEIIVPLGLVMGGIGTMFWLLVIVNTTNFMDGANGMAMGCSGIGLFGLCGLNIAHMAGGYPGGDYAILALIGAGSCAGFLFWNATKGAVFAGDSGALFIGLLSGSLGTLAVDDGVNPLCVALCFLPMLVDVILTVAKRLRRRQNVLLAHSDHAYQAAIKAGASHIYTSGRYWLASFFCIVMAFAAQGKGGWWPLGVFVSVTLVLSFLYFATFSSINQPEKSDDEEG
jgi:UDP-GlcNAc:undecaprenyl-phosphate/decaprenyl-phosphate GlcNAc-1-phosphate transferase